MVDNDNAKNNITNWQPAYRDLANLLSQIAKISLNLTDNKPLLHMAR